MVFPVAAAAVMAGAQILSSLAQMYQSEQARKADSAKLNELEKLFNQIKPPEYDVSIKDNPKFISESIPEPAFDYTNITPEAYKVAAKYVPEVAPFIAEKAPEVVKLSATGQYGKEAQIQALRDIKARTGQLADAEAGSASMKAMRDAQIAAQSRSQSILQDANRRGQLGSGAMLAAQLQGSSDQMERSAGMSNQAYLEALRNKLGALKTSGEMGRELANEDFSQQALNADIINKYNQRAASSANQYGQYAADVVNKGNLFNIQQAQDVADKNTYANNYAQYYNKNRQDQIALGNYERKVAERNYLNNLQQQKYANTLGQQDRANNAQSEQFNNAMRIAAAKKGMGFDSMDRRYGYTRDRNQAIQGIGNGIASGAAMYGYGQMMKPPEEDPTPAPPPAPAPTENMSRDYGKVPYNDYSMDDYLSGNKATYGKKYY